MKKHSQIDRARFAWNGVLATWTRESSFRTEVAISVIVAIVLLVRHESWMPWLVWGLGTIVVLCLELVNTAIEAVCDALHPSENALIGFAKDCAAGAVLVASVGMAALMAAILLAAPLWAEEPAPKEAVVLVHGIMNKPFVMDRIANKLREAGYDVHNWGYPSTGGLIEDHAARLHELTVGLQSREKIHFVGFSQGAIIIRYTLTHHEVKNAGRFVMIAPPNHGSEIAEDFYKYAWFRGLYGDKSIKQLFASQNEFLLKVGIPAGEFGIIAGGKGDDEGFSSRIPGDDDSTISVASARLEGARDFIVLPHQHTPLVFSSDTASQVASFIKEGKFKR